MNKNILGEIDTLNEKYQADIYFEARWTDTVNINSLNLTRQQQAQLCNENVTIKINELNPVDYWTPQLFIENAVGQVGQQDRWFTIKKSNEKNLQSLSLSIVNLTICEHRRVKGVFWEKLELNHVCSILVSSFLVKNKNFKLLFSFSFQLMFKT